MNNWSEAYKSLEDEDKEMLHRLGLRPSDLVEKAILKMLSALAKEIERLKERF